MYDVNIFAKLVHHRYFTEFRKIRKYRSLILEAATRGAL